MPPPYAGIARLRVMGRNHAGQTVNVLHFGTNLSGYDGNASTTVLTQLATAMLECVRDTFLPAVSDDWKLERITVQQLHPSLGDEIEVAGAVTDVGALAGSDVSFVSQLLSLKTGQGGRRKRGRMFLPPPPESGVTLSGLTDAQYALLIAFAACLISKFVVGGSDLGDWRLVVLSRTNLTANSNNFNAAVAEVTQVQANRLVASMRSRKVGKGS